MVNSNMCLERINEDIAGNIVFGMVSDILRGFNQDFLTAKLCGFSSQEAQSMPISDYVQQENLAQPPPPLLGGLQVSVV